MKLTIKQKKFADEYIISGNATEAYLKAYAKQSRASAEANARKLLGKYSVKAYIDERMKELEDKAIAKQTEIMQLLTKQARREEIDYQIAYTEQATYDDKGNFLGINKKAEIIETPTQNKDAIKALELLGKRYGMWTEKMEMQTENVVIIDDVD